MALFLLLYAQARSQATSQAETKGACSPANTGNNNTFTITCGIGKAQGDQMLKILNKILTNQLDPDAVIAKLDEILKAVNPNLPVTTYDCAGNSHTTATSQRIGNAWAGLTLGSNIGGKNTVLQEMVVLSNSGRYQELLRVCLDQIQNAPEWLTPRLFCGLAYLGTTRDKEKAKAMLSEYDSKFGPAYDAEPCNQVASLLRDALR